MEEKSAGEGINSSTDIIIMKHNIGTSIKLIIIGLFVAGIASYATASTWAPRPANPPSNNAPTLIHIAALDQEKLGGFGVGTFNALQAAQLGTVQASNPAVHLGGIVRGGTPDMVNSVVYFGKDAGVPPFVDSFVEGSLFAQKRLRANLLGNSSNKTVCADSEGKLVLCDSDTIPFVGLGALPNPVAVGGVTTLSVTAKNFDTLTSCMIDQSVGVVTMTQQGSTGTWQGTIPSTPIATPTIFTVTCTGTSSGAPTTLSATRFVGVNNATSGYYAHCFIADTQVTMADGSKKNIQDVQIGDVLKGETTNNTVLGYHQPTLDDGKLYGFNGGTAFVTAEHPFMTTEGWKSINPEKTKKEHIGISVTTLEIGDVLVTEKGLVTVKSIQSKDAPATTKLYNFILDGDHTYYADGYLVHNKEICNQQYSCGENMICIDNDGMPTPGAGSCSLPCDPNDPITEGGICKPGDVLTCSPQGYKMCL